MIRDGSGIWSLSDASPQPLVAPDGVTLVHLEWSSLGLDLVAFDFFGNAYFYTLAFALGRMQQHPANLVEEHSDVGVVVGLHWLPIYPNQFKVCH